MSSRFGLSHDFFGKLPKLSEEQLKDFNDQKDQETRLLEAQMGDATRHHEHIEQRLAALEKKVDTLTHYVRDFREVLKMVIKLFSERSDGL